MTRARPRSAADANSKPVAGLEAQARDRVLNAEYAIERSASSDERAAFHAFNRAHDLAVSFDASGAELRASGVASAGIHIGGVSVGREHAPAAVDLARGELSLGARRASGEVDMDGRCLQVLERRAGAVTEQWENRQDGLEQTLVVNASPAGRGQLVARVRVDAAKVEVANDGQEAKLVATAGGRSLHYAGFKVWDAAGKALPARMQPAAGGIELLVDDRDAQYPVTIDPVLGSTPTWSKSGAMGSADSFGIAVTSADINHDNHPCGPARQHHRLLG